MKAFLLCLLLIISALLLAGLQCSAQPRESDRDWIDSLAVKYRMAFIESAMLLDQASVDSMETRVNELILFSLNLPYFGGRSNEYFVKTIRQYVDERQARQLRWCAYKKEMRSARTDFEHAMLTKK